MKKTVVGMAVTMLASLAMAGDFYVLEIDQHMRAGRGNDTIKLKQQLRQQHGVRGQGKELLSVMMVAKTKHGGGRASLLVGQSNSMQQQVDGQPGTFRSQDETSYDRVLFKNPKSNSNGRWQIKLRGNFMVKQVVVEIAEGIKEVPLSFDIHTRTGRGGIDTLKLKQVMRQQTGLIPNEYELIGATVVGKSKHGGGTVALSVGHELSFAETLDGIPQQFRNDSLRTYSEVSLQNPKSNSNGHWQLKLRGNIKIKEVTLQLKKK